MNKAILRFLKRRQVRVIIEYCGQSNTYKLIMTNSDFAVTTTMSEDITEKLFNDEIYFEAHLEEMYSRLEFVKK